MQEIQPDILTGYNVILRKRYVPASLHSYYLKWLRYYLDFCSKYRLSEKSSKSLPQFIKKLKEKRQTEEQQKQAGHAVSIFLDMAKAKGVAGGETQPSTPLNRGDLFSDTKTKWQKAIAVCVNPMHSVNYY